MNQIEDRVYTLTEEAVSKAAEIMRLLEIIRYDPTGAEAGDADLMKEIDGLLKRTLEKARTVEGHTGKG